MRILKRTLQLSVLLLLFRSGFSQTPESILDSVNAGRKPEKFFTQFDRDFYQPGDMIWFKTYITVDGRPGMLSTVAKAELINEAGKVMVAQIIPVAVGTASGNMQLPADLGYGTYIFRLYTQQMLHTGIENMYYKPIPVLPSAGYFDKAVPVTDISLRFFPEGGAFLTEELNILAFAATDQQGKPANVTGQVKDSGGKDVVFFKTEYNGMGKIEITPKKGEQYSAEYTLPSGSLRTVKLPATNDEGTNLLVADEVVKKRLIVSSRFSANPQLKPAYILGEMDQTIIFKTDISKSNGHYMGRVPVKDLPGGLLHIGVFNEDHKLLAERTCFVTSLNDTAEATLLPVASGLSKRSKNHYDFMLPDSLEGTFSVSVTDIAQTELPLTPDNIIAATLVTSNLNRGANNPLYTIGPLTGNTNNDAVDLLLLVHEYKWNWKQLAKLAGTSIPLPTENYIPLRGNAYSARNKKPIPHASLAFIIQTKDSAINSFVAQTDDKGYFEVPGLFYEDTAVIFVKNNSDKNKDRMVEVEILSESLPAKYKLGVQPGIVDAQVPMFMKMNTELKATPVARVQPAIDFDTTVVVLEELKVISKLKNATQLLEQRYTKGLFSSSARTTIDFITDKPSYTAGNIFDYMKGRYSYIQVMGNYPNYSLVYRNMRSLGTQTSIPMSLYLDEMQVDASMLITVRVADIAMVRIYTSGIMGTGGALAVYTKRGEDAPSDNVYTGMNKFSMPGFSKTISFYSPDYESRNNTVIKNDNRKTLYWNPSLTFIPEDGRVPLSFYNTDQSKGYKIVLQGFTIDGKMVYMEKLVR